MCGRSTCKFEIKFRITYGLTRYRVASILLPFSMDNSLSVATTRLYMSIVLNPSANAAFEVEAEEEVEVVVDNSTGEVERNYSRKEGEKRREKSVKENKKKS